MSNISTLVAEKGSELIRGPFPLLVSLPGCLRNQRLKSPQDLVTKAQENSIANNTLSHSEGQKKEMMAMMMRAQAATGGDDKDEDDEDDLEGHDEDDSI
ncbi:hypothetical protein Acr_17g0007640 [Actinidia rufa]|uniref:Uncharacterized protein n=1 Tax=Actinidia rufa TaxID=165716 RepID=A0A7J0G343_9ERIC|nr:hypothetical protein Acr_17g0007640 [Actinidia rufa]